jgi:hypothetical protein
MFESGAKLIFSSDHKEWYILGYSADGKDVRSAVEQLNAAYLTYRANLALERMAHLIHPNSKPIKTIKPV